MRSIFLALALVFLASAAALADPPANPLAGDQETFDRAAAEYDAGRYENAYGMFLYLADHNDVAAMRNVALMKRKGLGCERDPEGARNYLKQAAEGGLATAAADLADMLLNGEGGPADPKGALHWLKLAAAARHPRAEYELAQMYETGNLVPKDIQTAESLYEDAAGAGMKEAYTRLTALKAGGLQSSGSAAPVSAPTVTPAPATSVSALNSAHATAVPQTTPGAAGGFVLQIGSYQSEADAMESWRIYKIAHAAAAEFEANVQRADLPGKGTWYRLRIGPFATLVDANALCTKLKASGGDCFPARQ
jgi:TPR repeat protein